MEQSQLIELIQTLKLEEKEQVLQFAELSFFNNGRMKSLVTPILKICLEHSWDQPNQSLEKKEVFSKLFPGQEFVEGKLEKVMVDAHKVVRSFLLTKHYFREDNEFHQNLDFSEVVRKRGLMARYKQLMSRLEKIHSETRHKESSYFYQKFLLESSIHYMECIQNQNKGDLNIQNVFLALDRYYYLNQLALLNRLLLQQKIASLDINKNIQKFLEVVNVPTEYLKDSPAIEIHSEIFSLLKIKNPESSHIRPLFEHLLRSEINLDKENLREFFAYLRNICVLVLSSNVENVEVEFMLHDLFKDNLIRGYLHYEGKLHPSRYWAVSSNAIRVKDYDWALEFIENYKNQIIGENQTSDIYRINLANYLFGVARFSDCLDNIPSASPFVDYLLHGKRLELKALYELHSDLLSYKLDAFKMYLSRTSQKVLSKSKKQNHTDFANLLHQLVYSNPGDPKRSNLLISRIQEKKQAAEWRWLLEKAKALKTP